MQYELCYLVGEAKEADLAKIKAEIEGLLGDEQCTLLPDEFEKKRKFSYPVKKEVRGIYIARRFKTPVLEVSNEEQKANIIGNLNNKLNLYSQILRFIIVKADELPPLKMESVEAKAIQAPKAVFEKKETKKEPTQKPEEIEQKLEEIFNI